jgi:hypothetical protein
MRPQHVDASRLRGGGVGVRIAWRIEVAMWQEVWKVLEKPRDIRHGHRHISNTFHMRDRGVSLGRRSTVGVWVSGSGMNEHLFRVRCVRPPDLRHPGRGSRSILSVKLHRLRG